MIKEKKGKRGQRDTGMNVGMRKMQIEFSLLLQKQDFPPGSDYSPLNEITV